MKFVKFVVFPIVALVALVIIVGFFMPKRLDVTVARELSAPADKIFPQLSNLKNWENWSPWKGYDTNMVVKRNRENGGVGQVQEWQSESEGNGRLEIINIEKNKSVAYQLTFVDWESTSDGEFILEPTENGNTIVTWKMIGGETESPFGRLMNAIFASAVKADFESGLVNLEEIVR